jgi:hypothetical protein
LADLLRLQRDAEVAELRGRRALSMLNALRAVGDVTGS